MNKTINQWQELSRSRDSYRKITYILLLFSVMQSAYLMYVESLDPIVVTIDGKEKSFLQSKREEIKPDKRSLEKLIKSFVLVRYQWEELNPSLISKEITHITTKGFNQKTRLILSKLKGSDFKGKVVKQDVSGLVINVTEEETTASFDKILRIRKKDDKNFIPLVIPTRIKFDLVLGDKITVNPLGVYINGERIYR